MENMEPGSDNEPDLSVTENICSGETQFKIQHINHEMEKTKKKRKREEKKREVL